MNESSGELSLHPFMESALNMTDDRQGWLPRQASRPAFVWVLLAIVTCAAHAWCVSDPPFLDDHWHQSQLRTMGWSVNELLQATTLEPARFMEMWWQDREAKWQYARPFSVLLMKAVFELSGGSIEALHLLSLVLHFLAAAGVYQLCRQLTRDPVWSVVGGLVFVVYAHSVFAVSWLAAQNAVLQTTLMLWALLVYVRASGLELHASPVVNSGDRDGYSEGHTASLDRPKLHGGLFAVSVFLWVLSLGSRENAVMLPAILFALDATFGGWAHLRRRIGAYAVFGAITIAFLVWRLLFFYAPMPGVYYRGPDGDGYLLWSLAKLMHYLCSAVWLSPMTVGPSGRIHPFQEEPWDCMLMAAILFVLGLGYYQAARRAPGFWIWPLWIFLSVLPVVPVLATPHSGYLCGVGFAIGLVLPCGLRDAIQPMGIGRLCRPAAIWFLVASSVYMPIYRVLWDAIRAAESFTASGWAVDEPPSQAVTDIFFLNLPFVNIYTKIQMQENWGESMENVRCHALTFAPDIMEMKQESKLRQLDDHRLAVSVEINSAGQRPYFSGLLGRFLVEGLRRSGPFHEGQKLHGEGYDVEIGQVSDEGVHDLIFEFPKPLASADYRFYLSSTAFGAWRVQFRKMGDPGGNGARVDGSAGGAHNVSAAAERLVAGEADASGALFDILRFGDPDAKKKAWHAIRDVGCHIARAMAAPCQDLLEQWNVPDDWPVVENWWNRYVDDTVLDKLWVKRDELAALRQIRRGIANGRENTSLVIRTDMYLSGRPFAGPRPARLLKAAADDQSAN